MKVTLVDPPPPAKVVHIELTLAEASDLLEIVNDSVRSGKIGGRIEVTANALFAALWERNIR